VNALEATIERTQFEDNTVGIALTGSSATVAIRSSLVTGGNAGIAIQPSIGGATSAIDMRNTTVSKAATSGIVVGGNGAATARLSITSSQLSDNGIGLDAQAGGTAYVSNTTIVRNAIGLKHLTGSIVSLQDNRVTSNGSDGTFSSSVSKQ
jgi:hypothetical protein